MEVGEATCVGWVKIYIEVLEGIPPYQQQLFFGGKTLDNCQPLSCYGIQGGSVLSFRQSVVLSACLCSRSNTFYVVHTYSSDLVGDVKAMIAEQTDVCADQLEVVYNREPLEDGQRLCDCGIRDLCTVDVFKKVQSKIVIESLTGCDFSETVEVHPRDTVVDVKRKIQLLVGVSPCELHLINTYNGEVLNDEKTLSSCIIWEGSTLRFMRRKPPLLTVKGGVGEVVTLAFSPWEYVRKLKADICRKMDISDQIRLFCRKKEAGNLDNLPSHDHTESSVAIGSIDAEILSREGFVAEEQQLILNGRELKSSHTLSDYKIQGEDTLYLIQTCTGKVITVFIYGLGGSTFLVRVEANCTVEAIKAHVSDRVGIPLHDARILFAGRQLENGRTLLDYNIIHGSELLLVLRIAGGGVPLHVKIRTDDFGTLEFYSTHRDEITVAEIKDWVQTKISLHRDFQWLIYHREVLKDTHVLSNRLSVVELDLVRRPRADLVFVKIHGSRVITLAHKPGCMIANLKIKIQDRTSIPADQQVLIAGSQALDNSTSLYDYGINPNTTLRLVITRMRIRVEPLVGDNSGFEMEVTSSETVQSVWARIGERCQLHVSQFRLFYAGQEIRHFETSTVADLNIQPRSALHLIVRQIHIRTSTRKAISLPFCQSTKLSELKKKIWRLEGIPPCQQHLLYACRTLEDDRTLKDYSIAEEDVLYLDLKEGRPSHHFLYIPSVCNLKVCWNAVLLQYT